MKTCTTCKTEKPLTEFYKDKNKPDGLYSRCKPCHLATTAQWAAKHKAERAKHAREWRARNPERAKAVARKSANKAYAENPEIQKARTKKWYADNRERALAYHREARKTVRAEYLKEYLAKYYEKNADRIKENVRRLELQNREKNRPMRAAIAMKRIAKKKTATPGWANLREIKMLYLEAAKLTAATGIKHHVDHIVPLQSKRVCGLHCEANLRVIPAPVNQSKGNRFWPDSETATHAPRA